MDVFVVFSDKVTSGVDMSWGVWGVDVVPFVFDGEGVDPVDEFNFGGFDGLGHDPLTHLGDEDLVLLGDHLTLSAQ